MGLLTNLLFFPVTGPVAGVRWTLGKGVAGGPVRVARDEDSEGGAAE